MPFLGNIGSSSSLSIVLVMSVLTMPVARGEIPLRVLVTHGGHGFQAKEFFAMWDSMPGVTYKRAAMPDSGRLLRPGLEQNYDVVVLYDMVTSLPVETREGLQALLARGIGVVSLHHNLAANPDWPEYRKIIGGKWLNKAEKIDGKMYGPSSYRHDEDLLIDIADKIHPITLGLKDFAIHDETYGNVFVDPGVHILLRTVHPRNVPAIAWINHYGKSRIVYYMAGHDSQAWRNPGFREVLGRSMHWVAGREVISSSKGHSAGLLVTDDFISRKTHRLNLGQP